MIAIVGAFVATMLTDRYSAQVANNTDLASRRAELEKLVVELDLRVKRLEVIRGQSADSQHLTAANLSNDGARAIAIVAGNSDTVTSTSEFKNEHVASILSRAESDAGVDLTDKAYLLYFTDLVNCSALEQTAYVVERLTPLVSYFEKYLIDREIPVPRGVQGASNVQNETYAAVDASSANKSEILNVLSSSYKATANASSTERCR